MSFSALQRAENSSIAGQTSAHPPPRRFQCSSASRKFLNPVGWRAYVEDARVSVLFSEPKIPQFGVRVGRGVPGVCFSALQRAENSSISSAASNSAPRRCFSALQRAENSSITQTAPCAARPSPRFSALQRAENSSIKYDFPHRRPARRFQCSSASRKFLNSAHPLVDIQSDHVSVLFSEPKIPQFLTLLPTLIEIASFSALQRAENSSIGDNAGVAIHGRQFQCSSASRKFLNPGPSGRAFDGFCVSVLFSEPKIPQSDLL